MIQSVTRGTFSFREILLPLGISFFTFQQIMYAVSVWKGEIKEVIVPDYLAYILYFPKITMGPLIEPVDFINQLNDRENKTVNPASIASGMKSATRRLRSSPS